MVMAGIAGIVVPGATASGTVGVGRRVAELTPRFPISVEPSGRPVLELPPVVVGVVDVGLDDAVMLLEPAPHMPNIPAVSSIPDAVDVPELCVIPDVAEIDDDISTDIAVLPEAAPVAGVEPAIAIPPPSYVDVEPYIPLGEVPRLEHAVPVAGTAMLPVTVGAGLMPGEASSVAPNPIPEGPTSAPVAPPSGDVAPTVGVGCAIPVTWANAVPVANKARQAANNNCFTCTSVRTSGRTQDLSVAGLVRFRLRTKIAGW